MGFFDMAVFLISFLALADTKSDIAHAEMFLSDVEMMEQVKLDSPPKNVLQLKSVHDIKSENNLRNTFWGLGSVSFVMSAYFYRKAYNMSSDRYIEEITTYDDYQQQEEEYEQNRQQFWFTSIVGLGLCTGGLTIHLLERTKNKTKEKETSPENKK